MSHRYDFKAQRLFVRAGLAAGLRVPLDPGQANYLLNVLRMNDGDPLVVFNGRDGEWRATVSSDRRRAHGLVIGDSLRPQPLPPDLHYLFAPLKHARLDYMVEKAVELGAGRLRPVITQHGQVQRVNRERMEANAIEAAEQCGILSIPAIDEPVPLLRLVEDWQASEGNRQIVYCDEDADLADPVAALGALPAAPLAVLVGPEGGFSAEERAELRRRPFVTAISLGPRILRADTAAVAALTLVQAVAGDWKGRA